jgi:hypothetical protein
LLLELSNFLRENKSNDLLVARDLNESISKNTMKDLFVGNRLFDIHKEVNNIYFEIKDYIYERGSTYINTVVAIDRLLKVLMESKLIKHNIIVESNYIEYLLDINL